MEISEKVKDKVMAYFKLKKVGKISNWDRLKVGETYHVPPLVATERFDFTLLEKMANCIRIKKIGSAFPETIYRTDVISNFIVKDKCHERNNTK